jgi:hypothetical protein
MLRRKIYLHVIEISVEKTGITSSVLLNGNLLNYTPKANFTGTD